MNIIKKLIKKLIERRTGEPENLIVSIDPSKVFKPERYYESIMTSFNETGCFTVHSADCMLTVLNEGKKNTVLKIERRTKHERKLCNR